MRDSPMRSQRTYRAAVSTRAMTTDPNVDVSGCHGSSMRTSPSALAPGRVGVT
jgi:hypothetical protein